MFQKTEKFLLMWHTVCIQSLEYHKYSMETFALCMESTCRKNASYDALRRLVYLANNVIGIQGPALVYRSSIQSF